MLKADCGAVVQQHRAGKRHTERSRDTRCGLLALLLLCCPVPAAVAGDLTSGTKNISLIDQSGSRHSIGNVHFEPGDDSGQAFAVALDGSAFTDHFLSMRPFRCLMAAAEWFCHLPYSYPLSDRVTPSDLSALSYRLLFLRKRPSEFGIDAWNGLYYQLTQGEDGTIKGRLLEGDLSILASPPENGNLRPINLQDFIPASAERRAFPGLVIE